MIDGECRVEGIPSPGSSQRSPSSHELVIDGLRLQLDLRILPGTAGGDATAAAVWRIESENVATLPLGAARRRAAAAAAAAIVGLSLLSIGLWFARSAERPPEGKRATLAPAPSIAAAPPAELLHVHGQPPTAPATASKRTGEAPPRPAPEEARVAPRIAVVPAEAEPVKRVVPPASSRPITTSIPPARSPRRLPAVAPAGDDLHDLFGDTK